MRHSSRGAASISAGAGRAQAATRGEGWPPETFVMWGRRRRHIRKRRCRSAAWLDERQTTPTTEAAVPPLSAPASEEALQSPSIDGNRPDYASACVDRYNKTTEECNTWKMYLDVRKKACMHACMTLLETVHRRRNRLNTKPKNHPVIYT